MEIHVQSFGARLRMRGGIFVLSIPDLSGAGNDAEHEYAPHQIEAILLYSNAGSLTTEAIQLAIQHQIDILVCDTYGNVTGRFQPEEPSAPVAIQAAQFRLIGTARSMVFVKEWTGTMLRRRMAFLRRLQRYRTGDKALLLKTTRQEMGAYHAQLATIPHHPVPEAAQAIRLLEAHVAKLYFNTLSSLLPPEYRFDGRSRQPAQDLFNAFLNYGYAVLYRLVEKAIARSGLNPYGGFLHSIERNQKGFLFDLTELYRFWVDSVVFVLCSRKQATQKHLLPVKHGYWLSQTGKALLLEVMYEQLDRPQPLDEEEGQGSVKFFMHSEIRSIAQAIRKEGKAMLAGKPQTEAVPVA